MNIFSQKNKNQSQNKSKIVGSSFLIYFPYGVERILTEIDRRWWGADRKLATMPNQLAQKIK